MVSEILERFSKKAPVCVMARGILQRTVGPEALDALFAEVAQRQYTRELLFSSVFQLMSLVVCRIAPSFHAAYQAHGEDIEVSLTSVYNKLNGIDIGTSQALVRTTAREMGAAITALEGARTPWMGARAVRILDGNCIEASEHRLKVLRDTAAGALPGKSLVVYDPHTEMAVDVFPCEDGHAQERSLLGEVLPTVGEGEVWIADRNFCTAGFLNGIAQRGAFFVIREHEGLRWAPHQGSRMERVGQSETGAVYEQRIAMDTGEPDGAQTPDGSEGVRTLRRIKVALEQPTRDQDTALYVLTNLPPEQADALQVAQAYRRRWTIETAFQELEAHLHSELNTLGQPKAALFAFCVALVAYNTLAVVKAALRSVHGETKVAEEVSGFHMAEHLARTYEGMMIAIEEPQWKGFEQMSEERFAGALRALAAQVNLRRFKKYKRGPKKPRTKPKFDPKVPHVSTAKLLK
jgi:hypothetical protein